MTGYEALCLYHVLPEDQELSHVSAISSCQFHYFGQRG